MAKTIVRPSPVTKKQFTLGLGFFVFFTPPGTGATNILDGYRLRDWSMSGVTFNMLDISDQMSMEVFIRQATGTANPGTATARVFYDPRKGMPTVTNKLQTINEGSYGKLTIAVNDQGATLTTAPLQVVMECDAVLQSYGNVSGTYGEVLYMDFVFQLCGEPVFYEVAMTGMT